MNYMRGIGVFLSQGMQTITIDNEVFEEIFSAEQIALRVQELGREIEQDLAGETPIVMSVLKGGVVFAADLARAIRTIDVELDFVRLTSYGNGETSSGTVVFAMPPSIPVSGRTVIVVEDIIDSGRSMHFLLEYLQKEGVAKIVVCSLLHKPESMVVNVPINYVGFVIPNRFVIGYGLDYKQFKRNIPSIYAKK